MNSNNSLILYELASEIINKCRSKKFKISVAESCTGGLISSIITSIPGSSEYFKGSLIAYSNKIKIEELGISPDTINNFGAVSKETVEEMAKNIRVKFKTSIGIASSGIAGPGGGTKPNPPPTEEKKQKPINNYLMISIFFIVGVYLIINKYEVKRKY